MADDYILITPHQKERDAKRQLIHKISSYRFDIQSAINACRLCEDGIVPFIVALPDSPRARDALAEVGMPGRITNFASRFGHTAYIGLKPFGKVGQTVIWYISGWQSSLKLLGGGHDLVLQAFHKGTRVSMDGDRPGAKEKDIWT